MKILLGLVQLLSVLIAGLLCGYLLGQSSIGKLMPQAIGWTTSLLFVAALILPSYRRIPLNSVESFMSKPLLILYVVALVLSTSISAIPAWNLPSERLGGFIPFSDASDYYTEVMKWPSKWFTDMGSRRPLNGIINITEYRLGGQSLLWIQFIRVSLLSLSIAVFTYTIIKKIGAFPGWVSGFVLLVWSWPYASSMLSEVNGITLAAAGMAVMLMMDKSTPFRIMMVGLVLLCLSYIVRPFNLLMPALIGVAIVKNVADTKRQFILNSVKVLFVAFSLTLLGTRFFGLFYNNPSGAINSNALYTVLGLARGTDWFEAMEYVYAENPNISDVDSKKLMKEMAVESIREHPELLMKSLARGFKRMAVEFFGELGWAFGIPKPRIAMQGQEGVGDIVWYLISHPYYLLTVILLGAILFAIFRFRANNVLVWLSMATLFSFGSIAPLLIVDGGWRIVATLYPGLALLPAIILVYIRENKMGERLSQSVLSAPFDLWNAIPVFLLVFVLAAIPFPAIVRSWEKQSAPVERTMRLNIGKVQIGKWLNGNTAIVPAAQLNNCSVLDEVPTVQDFFTEHSKKISHIEFSQGKYHIHMNGISGDSMLYPGWIIHPIPLGTD